MEWICLAQDKTQFRPSVRTVTNVRVEQKTGKVTRRITTFRSTTDRIYDGGPTRLNYIILQYILILYYNTYRCVKIAYSIQYSNMLYRFVA